MDRLFTEVPIGWDIPYRTISNPADIELKSRDFRKYPGITCIPENSKSLANIPKIAPIQKNPGILRSSVFEFCGMKIQKSRYLGSQKIWPHSHLWSPQSKRSHFAWFKITRLNSWYMMKIFLPFLVKLISRRKFRISSRTDCTSSSVFEFPWVQ